MIDLSSKSNKNLIFFILILISVVTIFFLIDDLKSNLNAYGEHCLIFYIPIFLIYIFFFIDNHRFFIKLIIFLLISYFPIILLNQKIFLNFGDDSFLYLKHAHYMLENKTLTFTSEKIPYFRQPGSPYFYMFELFFLKFESRLLQVINVIIFFVFYFESLKLINKKILNRNLNLIINLILFLTLPYSITSILMFNSEWISVLFIMLSFILFERKKIFFSILSLAIIPFIRQNFLFSSIFVFLLIIILNSKNKFSFTGYFLSFCIVLLFPIYHNLYFANSFNFFVVYDFHPTTQWPIFINNLMNFKINENDLNFLISIFYERISYIFLYNDNMDLENKINAIFVFPGIFLCIFLSLISLYKKKSFVLLICFLSIYLPTLVGKGYFPRFEYVSVSAFLFFYTIYQSKYFHK